MFSKAVFRDLFFQVHFTDMDFQKTNICIESNNMGACEAVLLGFFWGGGRANNSWEILPLSSKFPLPEFPECSGLSV